jgi:universal stress protein A
MITFARILYPTDFSQASEKALPYACDLTRTFGAALHLLYVVQDPLGQPWTPEAYGYDLNGVRAAWIRDAEKELNQVSARTGLHPVTACRVGRPAEQILEYAREIGADLIVMGSHGHGAVAQFLLGSVAERTVRHAPCPVLTVKELRQTVREVGTDDAATIGQASPTVA